VVFPAAPSSRTFGPYRIVAEIGRGGGGIVYRAWDPRLQREVALKVLHRRPGEARAERFIAEARAASALNHPNILIVHDAAFDDDTPYVVAELIHGRTLRHALAGRALPVRSVLDIATQIADGLAAAHEAGIVHRDLKPENIMLTATGRVKIVDFGLAHLDRVVRTADPPYSDGARGAADTLTETDGGLRAGTIPYMSPEQATGTFADFHSDQFSLGLVLFEMAVGHAPFRRDSVAETLGAIVSDEPPTQELSERGVPAPYRWIVERCLAKKPAERYASTTDLYRDLATLRDRVSEVVARPSSSTIARTPWWKRGLVVAMLFTAMVAAVLLAESRGVRRPVDDALTFAPLTSEPGYEGMPAWSPDGQTIAYVADVDGTLQVVTRQRSASGSAQITQAAYDCRFPFWSPDGKRLYFISLARNRESLWSISAAGGTPQVVIEDVSRAAISPDGNTIAFLRDERAEDIVGAAAVWLWTAAGGEKRYDAFTDRRFVEAALAFSPDGRTLALTVVPRTINVPPEARGWQLWLAPLSGGQPYRRLQSQMDVVPRVTNLAWMPDSRHLVLSLTTMGTSESHLWMADLDRDTIVPLTRGPGSESYPSASSDGTQLAFSAGESDYDVVEVSGGNVRRIFGAARNESDPAWSRDQSLLAYVTDRRGQEEIWVAGGDGRSAHRPLVAQAPFGDDRTVMLASPTFSPDGQRIAYQRNAQKPLWPLRIWISQTAGGPPVPLLPPTIEGYHSAPTWSPDGEWIAYADWTDGEWRLAKVRVGEDKPVILRTDGVPTATPVWSPNGDWITWETGDGFVLVSSDGGRERIMSDGFWFAHTWSQDGRRIFGIRESEDRRLTLVALDLAAASENVIADLGPSPPVNNPVKGLSVSADGRRFVTSIVNVRGDLWSAANVRWQDAPPWRRWFRLQ
jgi:eukaryotic-like serine/threonine-protein kinase